MQLAEIVAGNILDHTAARPCWLTLVGDDGHAQNIITQRPIAVAPGTACVRCDYPAQGCKIRIRYINGQLLPLDAKQVLKAPDGDTGLHGDGHIASRVIDDTVELLEAQADACPGWRETEMQLSTPAQWKDCLLFSGRISDGSPDFVDRSRIEEWHGSDIV